ncbi:unnamed protein product [Ilex paraguariensis]|uniref:RNase H type-1 domain-containing protein n=1 Tax=Ilex paraguariensis TaxID=185542 RepID=A0ABC8RPV1_9AQUA
MVKNNSQASWTFRNIFYQIHSILYGLDYQIQHSYHEGNTVADSLANQGALTKVSSTYSSPDSLPTATRLLMLQDRRQIRNLRLRLKRTDQISKSMSEPLVFLGLHLVSDLGSASSVGIPQEVSAVLCYKREFHRTITMQVFGNLGLRWSSFSCCTLFRFIATMKALGWFLIFYTGRKRQVILGWDSTDPQSDSIAENEKVCSEDWFFGTRLCSDSFPAAFAFSRRLLTCLSDLTRPIKFAFPSGLIRWSLSSMAAMFIAYFSSAHNSRLISPLLLLAGSSQLSHLAQAIGSLGSKYQLNYTLLQLVFDAAYTSVAFSG